MPHRDPYRPQGYLIQQHREDGTWLLFAHRPIESDAVTGYDEIEEGFDTAARALTTALEMEGVEERTPLLQIQDALDGVEWTPATLERIATIMIRHGYRIRGLDGLDRDDLED